MGLKELQEELKEQIKEAEKAETEEVKDEVVEETAEEAPQETENEGDEEKQPEQEKAEEKEPDDRGYRKLRRDKEAAEKKARDLEEKLKAIKSEPEKEAEVKEELPPEVAEVVEERKFQKAGQEFSAMEAEFKKSAPEDFEDVSLQYKVALYQANRAKNPRWTHEQLLAETNKELLLKASYYVNQGYNPIEELYEDAKSMGFKARPKEEEEAEEKEVKPNLKKVAENRARNAGTAAAKGRAGTPQLTKESAAGMTVGEWSKLPASERQRIMRG